MCCMRDIKNIFITRTSYGRVWCWLGKPLKTSLEKVSSAKWTLQRVRHEGAKINRKNQHQYLSLRIIKNRMLIYMLLYIYNIHDQLHAIMENLQVLSAEVRSKLKDNVVVSVEGGMVVKQSLWNTQVADVVNKVFKCPTCHASVDQVRLPQFSWPVLVSYLKKQGNYMIFETGIALFLRK